MKNILKFLILTIFIGGFVSCEDEDKNPLAEQIAAPFVFIDTERFVLDVTDLENSTFGGQLVAPANNVVSYTIEASLVTSTGATDFAEVITYTEFPAQLAISAGMVADALGLDLDDFAAGDRIDFRATSVGTDGVVTTFETLAPDLQAEPGQRQAYNYSTFVSCPFSAEEAAGTYEIVEDGFGTDIGDGQFELVAGPGENQVTMVNPFDHPNPDAGGAMNYEVIIDVDPNTGIASIDDPMAAWHCDNFGCPYGEGRVNTSATSFVFSCVGVISATLRHTVNAGSFGSYAFKADKLN